MLYQGKENSVTDWQKDTYGVGGWMFKPDTAGKAVLVT